MTGASLFMIIGGSYYVLQRFDPWRPQTATVHQAPIQQLGSRMTLGQPASLTLPNINTTLDIKPGHYNASTQQWTLDDSHAFYMHGSATPLIYGHNKSGIFDQLGQLRVNDLLLVTNDAGVQLVFAYTTGKTVAPDDSSLLQEKHPDTLMLMSCTGLFYESRRVLYFDYVGIGN